MVRRLAVLLSGLMFLGCGGGAGEGPRLTQDSLQVPDEDGLEAPPDLEGQAQGAPSWLEFFDRFGDDGAACQGFSGGGAGAKILHCQYRLAPGEERQFRVLYLEDGVGVAGRKLDFRLRSKDASPAQSLASLDLGGALSDQQGLASFTLRSKGPEGKLLVEVSAPDLGLPGAGSLFFHISIERPQALVELAFSYQGQQRPEGLELLFLEAGRPGLCKTLDPRSPPKALAELAVAGPDSKASLKAEKLLGDRSELQLAVLALGHGKAKDGQRPLLLTGCLEAGTLRAGEGLALLVPLRDLPWQFEGRYRVTSHLELLSALPPGAQGVVETLLGLFESPGGALLTLACQQADGVGLLGGACGLLFTGPVDVEHLSLLGELASEAVDQGLEELLAEQGLGSAWGLGQDLSAMLQSVELLGSLQIAGEPDPQGMLAEEQVWLELTTLRLRWAFGLDCQGQDPDCGLLELDLEEAGDGALLEGSFQARVPGFSAGQQDELEILPFSAKFRYGVFLALLLRQVVLPSLAGPEVQDLEGFLGALVGGADCVGPAQCCQGFGDALGYGEGTLVGGLLVQGCALALPLAAGYLEGSLEALALDGDELWLATPPERPCGLHFDAGLRRLERLAGTSDDPKTCQWRLGFGAAGKELRFDGDFVGTRIP